MGIVVKQQLTNIKTDDGHFFVRRVTTVQLPNGKYRYPVDYYDATPGAVEVSKKEIEHLKVPGYKQFI